MSYVTPTAGEDFSIRVISKLDGPVPIRWANTWEVSGGLDTTQELLDDIADGLALFHKALLLEQYMVEKVVISTLAADGQPYDPETFAVREVGLSGTRGAAGSQPYTLNACLLVKKSVAYGRSGSLLLRGMLTEAEVDGSTGLVKLANVAALQSNFDTAFNLGSLGSYLAGGSGQTKLALITPGTLNNTEREITGMVVQRLTHKKLNNKYFNRS